MLSIAAWTSTSAACARNSAALPAPKTSFDPFAASDIFSPPPLRRKRRRHEPPPVLEDLPTLLGRAGTAARRALHTAATSGTRRQPMVGTARTPSRANPRGLGGPSL